MTFLDFNLIKMENFETNYDVLDEKQNAINQIVDDAKKQEVSLKNDIEDDPPKNIKNKRKKKKDDGNVEENTAEKTELNDNENIEKKDDENESKYTISGNVGISNKGYLGDGGGVISENPTVSASIRLNHKSGLGANIVRLDDMTDTDTGRVSGLGVSYARQFGLPNDRNFYTSSELTYVDFQNNRNLNEIMPCLRLKLNNGTYAVSLTALYNAYLNRENQDSVIANLELALQATKTTNVSIKGRWKKNTQDLNNQFYGAIKVDQKLPKDFSVWLQGLYKEGKPQIIFGLNKSF